MKRAPRQLSLLTPPQWSNNAVLSAFVKCIRLRYETDALKYLRFLWDVGPTEQFRAQRRILIASAEDSMSAPVMRAVSDWFNSPRRYQFEGAVREVLRICKTPNWYETATGRDYIRAWRLAELARSVSGGKTREGSYLLLEQAVAHGDLTRALRCFYGLYENASFSAHSFAEFLIRLSANCPTSPSHGIAEVYAENAKHLGRDSNFSGQCLYFLMVEPCEEQADPTVTHDEETQYSAIATSLVRKEWEVPTWALDGIHCEGNDPRFAGELSHMFAACNAYEHYGQLCPNDKWLPDFHVC